MKEPRLLIKFCCAANVLPTELRDYSLKEAQTEEPSNGQRPLKRNSENKYLSCSLRLNNNSITDLTDLQKTINHFLAEPSQLAWLDLSFNKITHINPVLCELRKLLVLYLHGNSISALSEVDKLGVLPHLHTITLHGNVIDTIKGYRRCVVSALPQLKRMDFSVVTHQERDTANICHRSKTHSRRTRKGVQ